MYTKQQLKQQLSAMGLKPCDNLLIHSSMKAIGDVEGGADTVLDSFMEYLKDGLFMAPAHTWAQMNEDHCIFDPENEPSCVGILSNLLLKRPGTVRSLHPTHSMAVYGKGNQDYIKGEEYCTTPCPPGGCWDRLRTIQGKILLIGVNHVKNTFIHSVEEVLNVPERFTEKPVTFSIKMPDSSLRQVSMYRHYNSHTAHISESFSKLEDAFYYHNAAKKVRLGDADCILCDAEKLFGVTSLVLSHEINCLIDRDTIPGEWWKNTGTLIKK